MIERSSQVMSKNLPQSGLCFPKIMKFQFQLKTKNCCHRFIKHHNQKKLCHYPKVYKQNNITRVASYLPKVSRKLLAVTAANSETPRPCICASKCLSDHPTMCQGWAGHRVRNSDSTSIYYYKIRELKKTFKFDSGNPNYLPEVSFK